MVREGGKTSPSNKPLPTSGEIKGIDEDVFALNPQMSKGVRKSRASTNGAAKAGGKSPHRNTEVAAKTATVPNPKGKAAKGKPAAGRKSSKATSSRKRAR